MAKISINVATGEIQKDSDIVVGIDFGTTNSLISVIDKKTLKPIILKKNGGYSLVPTIIFFEDENNIVVGEEAKKKLIYHPQNTIFSVKRLIGKSYKEFAEKSNYFSYEIIEDEKNNQVKIKINDKFYSTTELASFVLKELKKNAEEQLQTKVQKAVITVPAYFNDIERQIVKDAGKLAGLNVLRIINEPTAACLAYGFGLDKNTSKIIAVYDLGGGTFDISILQLSNGVFDVLSTNGDTYLGGDDIDREIVFLWKEKYNLSKNIFEDAHLFQQLRLISESAKIYFSAEDNTQFTFDFEGYNLILERKEFENIVQKTIDKTIAIVDRALSDANLGKEDIEDILMVGGSTKSPFIKKKVSEYFAKKVVDVINPEEAVALGAAIQADILAGNNKDFLLLDITPLSLGIETIGGLMDVIIPRNSKIPTLAQRQYTTQKDGQSGIVISVYQGERDLVQHNKQIGEFVLKGIPSMPAGIPKVEITFQINVDGILNVSAKELRSGVSQSIEINSKKNITDKIVEDMLESSIENSKYDLEQRALIEAENEAKQIVEITEKFILKNKALLTKNEFEETTNIIAELRKVMLEKNKNAIQASIHSLEKITKPFSERIMDITISEALKGKKV